MPVQQPPTPFVPMTYGQPSGAISGPNHTPTTVPQPASINITAALTWTIQVLIQ